MRKLCLGLSFIAMAAFVACSSGSGTNADSESLEKSSNSSSKQEKDYDGEVEYADDLPKCTERKDGMVYYVEDEDISYTCTYDDDLEKGEWVKKKKRTRGDDDDQESSSSIEDEESSSSAKKTKVSSSSAAYGDKLPEKVETLEEALALDCNVSLKCQKVFVEEFTDNFYCDGKEMRPYSPILDADVCPVDDDDEEIPDVERCDVSRDGDKVFVTIVADGISENIAMSIDAEGIITETAKFDSKISYADFDSACKDTRNDSDNLSVECDASALTITATYRDEEIEDTDDLEANNTLLCQMLLDPESWINDNGDTL